MRKRSKGQTLAELMVTLSIMLLGFGAVMVNLRHREPPKGAKELAKKIALELRNTRNLARAIGNPRGIAFPGTDAGGSTLIPCSQSMYTVRGLRKTYPRSIKNFSGEYPNAYIFMGVWGGTAKTINSPANSSPFKVATWMNPLRRDYVIAFRPDGTVCANDVPHDASGNYQIVVCDGLDYRSITKPSGTSTVPSGSEPGSFELTKVNNPQTITITPSGSIGITGYLNNPGGVTITNDQAAPPPTGPAPAPVVTIPTTPPILEKPVVSPPASALYTSQNMDSTVPPGGILSMTILAYDNDGDELTYSCACTGGTFTYPSGGRLMQERDPYARAKVNWVPPPNAPVGSTYQLIATVTDETGLAQSATNEAIIDVKLVQDGFLAYINSNQLWTINADGTGAAYRGSADSWPDISPNGRQIAYVSHQRIYSMDSTGANAKCLWLLDNSSTPNKEDSLYSTDDCPCWSRDGSKVVFSRSYIAPHSTKAGQTRLQIVDASGFLVKKDFATGTAPNWCRASDKIVFEDGGGIYQTDPNGSVVHPLDNSGTSHKTPVWSNDGSFFIANDSSNQLVKYTVGGAPPTATSSSLTPRGSRVAFQPQGSRIAFIDAPSLTQYDLLLSIPYLPSDWGNINNIPSINASGTISWGKVQ